MSGWFECWWRQAEAGRNDGTFGVFLNDFLSGFGTGMLLMALVWLLIILIRRRRRARGIMIRGESGFMYVTPTAVREFVARVLDEFNEAALCAVSLRQNREHSVMTIAIQVSPDAEVVTLVEDIRRRIIQQAVAKLGMQKTLRVNVNIRSFARPDKAGIAVAGASAAQRNILTGFPNLAGVVPPEEREY